jgi:hypothetical protein
MIVGLLYGLPATFAQRLSFPNFATVVDPGFYCVELADIYYGCHIPFFRVRELEVFDLCDGFGETLLRGCAHGHNCTASE